MSDGHNFARKIENESDKLTSPTANQVAAIFIDKSNAVIAVTMVITATEIPYARLSGKPKTEPKRIADAAIMRM